MRSRDILRAPVVKLLLVGYLQEQAVNNVYLELSLAVASLEPKEIVRIGPKLHLFIAAVSC